VGAAGSGILFAWLAQRWIQQRQAQVALIAAAMVLLVVVAIERRQSYPYGYWWHQHRAAIHAMRYLRDDPMLQALVLHGVSWPFTPGYNTLQRDVPMVQTDDDQAKLKALAGNYTHIMSREALDEQDFNLELIEHWFYEPGPYASVYLYRAIEPYQGPPKTTLQQQLIKWGE